MLVDWLNQHDPHNWFIVLFSLVVWPLALAWWRRRTVNSVPGLEIVLASGEVGIGPPGAASPYKAISVRFINRTGAVVYLTSPRVTICRENLPVTPAAEMDATTGAHVFAFVEGQELKAHELTLHTNSQASGAIALSTDAPPDFFAYTAPQWRRWLRRPKYFVLAFRAVVGGSSYNVKMIH